MYVTELPQKMKTFNIYIYILKISRWIQGSNFTICLQEMYGIELVQFTLHAPEGLFHQVKL